MNERLRDFLALNFILDHVTRSFRRDKTFSIVVASLADPPVNRGRDFFGNFHENGNFWQFFVFWQFGNFWQFMANFGNLWQFIAIFGNLLQCFAIYYCNLLQFCGRFKRYFKIILYCNTILTLILPRYYAQSSCVGNCVPNSIKLR